MKVFSIFKNISKAKKYKLEKMNMTNMVDKGLISFIDILKTLNMSIHKKVMETIAKWTKESKWLVSEKVTLII